MTEIKHYMDVRLPMGIFFTLCGAAILLYGLLNPSPAAPTLLGAPVNVSWGGCVGVFGLALLALSSRRKAR